MRAPESGGIVSHDLLVPDFIYQAPLTAWIDALPAPAQLALSRRANPGRFKGATAD